MPLERNECLTNPWNVAETVEISEPFPSTELMDTPFFQQLQNCFASLIQRKLRRMPIRYATLNVLRKNVGPTSAKKLASRMDKGKNAATIAVRTLRIPARQAISSSLLASMQARSGKLSSYTTTSEGRTVLPANIKRLQEVQFLRRQQPMSTSVVDHSGQNAVTEAVARAGNRLLSSVEVSVSKIFWAGAGWQGSPRIWASHPTRSASTSPWAPETCRECSWATPPITRSRKPT